MVGRIWIENEGLGLFRARRKNSRKWLEGYYVRVLETAGYHSPAFCHYIIFQEANSGRVCRAEVSADTLCRCTGVQEARMTMTIGMSILTKSSAIFLIAQSAETLEIAGRAA